MNYTNWVATEKEIEEAVTRLFGEYPPYPFHNLFHTISVVIHSKEMTDHYLLSAEESFIVVAAAWFHDTGQLNGPEKDHEERSVEYMLQHLSRSVPGLTNKIRKCILATKMNVKPTTLLEAILCDADTYHVGTDLFRETNTLVMKEIEQRQGSPATDWPRKSLDFLMRHVFHTDYCRKLLDQGKVRNMRWLMTQIEGQNTE